MSGRCRGKASGLDKTGTGPKSGAVIERARSDDHFWSSMTIRCGNGKFGNGPRKLAGTRNTECLVEWGGVHRHFRSRDFSRLDDITRERENPSHGSIIVNPHFTGSRPFKQSPAVPSRRGIAPWQGSCIPRARESSGVGLSSRRSVWCVRKTSRPLVPRGTDALDEISSTFLYSCAHAQPVAKFVLPTEKIVRWQDR
jgi:hypothetical protein